MKIPRGYHGWALLVGVVAVVDILAPETETMSEALYRARDRHPVLVSWLVLATAGHLLFGDAHWYRRFDVFKIIQLSRRAHGGHITPRPPSADEVWFRLDWNIE